jgi:branched-chain amino acid transport system substrate-binding protein
MERHFTRRRMLQIAAGGVAAAVLAACGRDEDTDAGDTTTTAGSDGETTTTDGGDGATTTAAGSGGDEGGITGGGGGDGTIRIGYVTPSTGGLAPFGAADEFILAGLAGFWADGLRIGGQSYTVEVLVRDSESSPDRAASEAAALINEEGIDLMLVGSTPETTNPVSDQCEANGVPCISTTAPWQPWVIGRGGVPGEKNFDWTYHFFWGLEDIIPTFISMWSQLDTNQSVGGLFPNDGDGNAWGDPEVGFPKPLADAGFALVDPGRYENLNQDFTAQINAFRDADAQIITGVVIPPDFPTFWRQAKQQGFVPQAASIGKALLFPESIAALGADGVGLSSEVWWSPNHPYTSSLVGLSAAEVAEAYTAETGNQWTQPIGFAHALFEVAVAALVAAGSTDKAAVRDAIAALTIDTVVGPVDFAGSPVGNVAKTRLVGGQWREADTPTGFDLVIVDNSGNPDVPTAGALEPIA